MRYLFLLLTFMVTSFGFSQLDTTGHEYPKYLIEENDTFVVITLEQAQKVDNDYELLYLLEDLVDQHQLGDSVYIKLINEQEEQISILKVEVEALKDVGNDKDTVISKLKEEIELYKENEGKFQEQLDNKDAIIAEKDKQIRKHKIQKIFAGIGGSAAIIGLVILLLVK